MIINDDEALKRLASPLNLINKLRDSNNGNNKRKSAMSLFGVGRSADKKLEEIKITFNPFINNTTNPQPQETLTQQTKTLQPLTPSVFPQPSTTTTLNLDNILENHDSQIKLGLAHDNALALLNRSVDMLAAKLDDVRADKLPAVVSSASRVVESIRKERNESRANDREREVHYHFYTPSQKKIEDYEVIDIGSSAPSF